MHRKTLLGLACAIAFVSGSAVAAPPQVTDLGAWKLAQGVSDDGTVVAGVFLARPGQPERGAFRWTQAGGVQSIGGVDIGFVDLSADGGTIAGTVMTDRLEAAFWTAQDDWKPLSASGLLFAPPGWETFAQAISANGRRIAGYTTPPPVEMGRLRPFSFNPDTSDSGDYGWQELPKLRKGDRSEATDISDDGLVQVGRAAINGPFQAVRWTNGMVEPLLDGQRKRLGGETVRCNRDCSVIVGGGGGYSLVNPVRAWRLRPASRQPACYFKPLAGLPPMAADTRYYAYRTSETGNVVVGAYYYTDFGASPPRQVRKGFLWIGDARGGTMHDLQAYLTGLGLTFFDSWPNIVPTSLSSDGRYLVGWGDDAQGQLRGWRVDLGGAPVARASDGEYTPCPTARGGVLPVANDKHEAEDIPRLPPSGEFRSADGRRYFVRMRGAGLAGGARADKLTPLVSLGGDEYYDSADGSRRSFVRNRAGVADSMRQRRGSGAVSVWRRRDH